jgi:hypothetical protein
MRHQKHLILSIYLLSLSFSFSSVQYIFICRDFLFLTQYKCIICLINKSCDIYDRFYVDIFNTSTYMNHLRHISYLIYNIRGSNDILLFFVSSNVTLETAYIVVKEMERLRLKKTLLIRRVSQLESCTGTTFCTRNRTGYFFMPESDPTIMHPDPNRTRT